MRSAKQARRQIITLAFIFAALTVATLRVRRCDIRLMIYETHEHALQVKPNVSQNGVLAPGASTISTQPASFETESRDDHTCTCGPFFLEKIEVTNNRRLVSGGCAVRIYKRSEIQECAATRARQGNPDVVFIGDSRIRNLFAGFVSHLTGVHFNTSHSMQYDLHKELQRPFINFDFIWSRYLEGDAILRIRRLQQLTMEKQPGFVLLDSGLWYMVHRDPIKRAFRMYKESLRKLLPEMEGFRKSVKVIWVLQDHVREDALSGEYNWRLKNKFVDEFNDYAVQLISNSSVYIWKTMKVLTGWVGDNMENSQYGIDGAHVGPKSLLAASNLLMNIYCRFDEPVKVEDGSPQG